MTVRYDAINKMLVRHMEDVNANKGRAAYSGKGADETDKFLGQMAALRQKYTVPKFWIMLEKEFKDDKVSLILFGLLLHFSFSKLQEGIVKVLIFTA